MVKAKLGKALAKKLSDFIDEMKDKYAMTPDQTKSAIRNYANEGYLPKDPKRMLPGDDEPLALMVTNNTILPSTKADFMQDIFEQSVMDDVLGEARKELDLLKLKRLDPTKMTKQADGGRVGMIKGGLLKGIASLFKSKGKDVAEGAVETEKVFARNLIDEFGKDEVSEAFRIIDKADADPQLSKLFYRENESKMDELVNLLEARYMGSTRLQAHPLSFKRRGSGAADRYARINDTGGRLTDLPGGPGDRVLYYKHYGEMSPTVIQGKKVYDRPPTIFDEGTKIVDEGKTIEGVAETIDPEDAVLKNMKDMAKEAEAMRSQTEVITDFARRDQEQIAGAIETFNRMLDAGEDPADALQFLKDTMKRTNNADGGRVGAKVGGLMSLLKQLGMKSPDKIADKKQIENVIRDPKTDLERIYKDRPSMGTKATPKDQPTIDEIRDMVQNDPRYDKLTAAQMDEVVKRETVRADFAYNMGISPEEVDDQIVDMLMMEGYASKFGFNMGGLIPPQKGPMSEGMGTLYRSK